MSQNLPAGANLDQLRKQAKELAKAFRSGDPEAARRAHDHGLVAAGPAGSAAPFTLALAQLVVAREYGFKSWRRMKKHIEIAAAAAQLKDAIDRNDLKLVRNLVESDRSLLTAPIGYGGGGPLTWAAECRGAATPPAAARLAIVRFLIEAGADIHEGGDLPLMRACLNDGRIAMIELLAEHGADLNARCKGNYPILFAPCETLAPAVLSWLLEHGADPTARGDFDAQGGTALDLVIETYSRSDRQQECARLLIDAGAVSRFDDLPTMEIHCRRPDLLRRRLQEDPSLVHRRFPQLDYGGTAHCALTLAGTTLLHVAASFGDCDSVRQLLESGADINAPAEINERGVGGQSPLFHAVAHYHDFGVPATRCLVENGANLSLKARVPGRYDFPEESLEVTPLGFAARFPPPSVRGTGVIDLLLEHDAPAGDVYAAALLGLVGELKHLLDSGADPDYCNLDGESALQAASAQGHTEVGRMLLEAGAQPLAADPGKAPAGTGL